MHQGLNDTTASTSHRNYGATGTSSSSSSQFSPTELISLSDNIARNIHAVDSNCKKLQRIIKDLNKPNGRSRVPYATRIENVHSINTKTNALNEIISKDLQRFQNSVVGHIDKSEKKQQELQLQRLKTKFQTIIQEYSLAQKDIFKQIKLQIQAATSEYEEDAQNTDLMGTQQLQQQQRISDERMRLDNAQRRTIDIQELESDMLAINSMMRVLSEFVHEQGEQVDSIEVYVNTAGDSVEEGHRELAKADRSSRSYRRKILILLVIAVIVGLIVTGIIVAKISK